MNGGTSRIVRSADGTAIAVWRFGDGPPLVVVPGALSDVTAWSSCAPLLAAYKSVHVMDRRGKGASGHTDTYEPEREVEDVLAVLADVGGPADVLGHSSGAILALQAAQRAPELRRIVLYEPPVFLDPADRIPDDLADRLDVLLASGEEDAALETFLREAPRDSEADIRRLRDHHAAWPRMMAIVHTIPYDTRVQQGFDLDLDRLATMRTPTLMIVGAVSPPRIRNGSLAIARVLPDVRLEELAGQGHLAQLLAPDVLAAAVLRFLADG